jgi:zinc transporter 2
MLSLAFVSIGLAYEAIRRLIHEPEGVIDGPLMSGIAAIGVCVNIALALVLGEDHVHMPGAHDHSHSHDHDHGNHAQCGSANHSKGHSHTVGSTDCGHDEEKGLETPSEKNHHHSHHSHDHDNHARCSSDNRPKELLHNGDSHNHHNHGHETDALLGNNDSDYDTLHSDEVPKNPEQKKAEENVNLRAIYLHVMGDLAQSAAVLIAGVVIWFRPDWQIIDPICTLFFCILVFLSTLGVLRSSISVLLEEVPPGVDWQKVYNGISNVEGVTDVHDLHIWSISHGDPALSVHCNSSNPNTLQDVYKVCKSFGITHATIQIQFEIGDGPCITCTDEDNAGCSSNQSLHGESRYSVNKST